MPSYAEIRRSVEAAWLLARGETRAMALFDVSLEGFWKSFAAALLVAPAYAIVLLDQYRLVGWPEHVVGTMLAEAVSFAVGWVAFPIVTIFLTRLLGLGARYVPLIVANNWSAVVQVAPYTTVVIVGTVLPTELRTLALFVATLAVLTYQWFVIRTALQTTSATAFGFVVVDILVSLMLSRGLDGLLQPG
jgi:hypothetical protein